MTYSAYQELENRFSRWAILEQMSEVLQWDWAAKMPEGGQHARSEQLALLRVLIHQTVAASDLEGLLIEAETVGSLDPWQAANLREMRRVWIHTTALDEKLVDALSRAQNRCEMAWRKAKTQSGSFAEVAPELSALLALVREAAAAKAERLGCSPYDALLDQYEPGGRSAEIDEIFDDLASFIPNILPEVMERQAKRPPISLKGEFALEQQRAVALSTMQAMGFDFRRGRLDESLHPFCGGVPEDVRLTTRYVADDFRPALLGVIHETGHALYEQGLPANWQRQPVGRARGMSIHESQSLIMEMQAARTPEFARYLAPCLEKAFPGMPMKWNADRLMQLLHRVIPGYIRVESDEVTYPAHVILRYRLEKALVDGTLTIPDLPEAWNAEMRKLLGLTPRNDQEGCLQDIHWYDGAFGYFPTYTLGAMTAAQLFAAACDTDPDIRPRLEQGDFSPLLSWLRSHIHSFGSQLSTADLLTQATGTPLKADAFKTHLKRRYLEE